MVLAELMSQCSPLLVWPRSFIGQETFPLALLPEGGRTLFTRRWFFASGPHLFPPYLTRFILAAHHAGLPWPPWHQPTLSRDSVIESKAHDRKDADADDSKADGCVPGADRCVPGAPGADRCVPGADRCPFSGLHLDCLSVVDGVAAVEFVFGLPWAERLFRKTGIAQSHSKTDSPTRVWCSKTELWHALRRVFGAAHLATVLVETSLALVLPIFDLDRLRVTTPYAKLEKVFRHPAL
jgi:hypothetical protein